MTTTTEIATRPILSKHCVEQAKAKGLPLEAIRAAAVDPEVTYESHRYPGQYKHIKDGLCVVVDRNRSIIITVFLHHVRTALRPDQVGA